jgi:hypothetical protein
MESGLGKTIGIGGLIFLGGTAVWRVLSPDAKRWIDGFAGDVFTIIGDNLAEDQRKRRLALEPPPSPQPDTDWIGDILRGWELTQEISPETDVPDVEAPPSLTSTDHQWHQAVTHPSVVLILGKRGSGKSALAYRLLELFRYQTKPYVVGAPNGARNLLPTWIGLAPSLEAVREKSIVLVDEAYLSHHARESQAKKSLTMSRLLNLSRQREQTLIFVTQEARQVDRNIASSASVIIFKEPGPLQFEFERPELRRIAQRAKAGFESITRARSAWSYVYSPDADYAGMVENALPTYWTTQISHLFRAGQGTSTLDHPIETTVAERRERAKDLRSGGLSYSEIARELGVSKSTVTNYLKNYPYRK